MLKRNFGVEYPKYYTESDIRQATGIGFVCGTVSGFIGVLLIEGLWLWVSNYI